MKMNENLNQLFNLENHSIPSEDSVGMLSTINLSIEEKKEQDFDLARNTLKHLIVKNQSVLSDLVDLARNSESPRAFEVAGQLIKTQAEMAKDLMSIHKTNREISQESNEQYINTQNNIVFAGSTSDLMKMISAHKAKSIDSE